MKKICFVCHGNICRSPMAQAILQAMVNELGLSDRYEIDSRALSQEEIGASIYPPARKMLLAKGIPPVPHMATLLTVADLDYFDELYLMDANNWRWFKRRFGECDKVSQLLAYDVADPWYTGDFEKTFQDCVKGCKNILEKKIK